MPRFAILRHDSPRRLHWDLLLETGDVLRSWALSEWPQPGVTVPCEALADHRLAYLDYEGPVSGGRGSVVRWDRGHYRTERESPGRLQLALSGEKLCGSALLEQTGGEAHTWRFTLLATPPPPEA